MRNCDIHNLATSSVFLRKLRIMSLHTTLPAVIAHNFVYSLLSLSHKAETASDTKCCIPPLAIDFLHLNIQIIVVKLRDVMQSLLEIWKKLRFLKKNEILFCFVARVCVCVVREKVFEITYM